MRRTMKKTLHNRKQSGKMGPKRKPPQQTHPPAAAATVAPDPPPDVPESKASGGSESKRSGSKKVFSKTIQPKKRGRTVEEVDIASDDSGDHTSDEELNTDEDSAGSLVDFVVDDDASVEELDNEEEEEEKEVEIVVSAVYENGVRRSTRNKKPVERYVDSDYEDLMCADADPKAALESSEDEEEENEETATEDLETTEAISESDD